MQRVSPSCRSEEAGALTAATAQLHAQLQPAAARIVIVAVPVGLDQRPLCWSSIHSQLPLAPRPGEKCEPLDAPATLDTLASDQGMMDDGQSVDGRTGRRASHVAVILSRSSSSLFFFLSPFSILACSTPSPSPKSSERHRRLEPLVALTALTGPLQRSPSCQRFKARAHSGVWTATLCEAPSIAYHRGRQIGHWQLILGTQGVSLPSPAAVYSAHVLQGKGRIISSC